MNRTQAYVLAGCCLTVTTCYSLLVVEYALQASSLESVLRLLIFSARSICSLTTYHIIPEAIPWSRDTNFLRKDKESYSELSRDGVKTPPAKGRTMTLYVNEK